MPTFMDSLAANPGGSISGMPGAQGGGDTLAIVNNIKDREMRDYQSKANFMADLSIKQDRLRKLYGLDGGQQGQQAAPQGQSPASQQQMLQGMDPNSAANTGMNPMQKAELGIRQQQANTASQRVNQQGQFGQQAQDTRSAQEKLNEQKNENIHQQKQAELQVKMDEYKQKIDLSTKALSDKNANLEAQVQAHKDLAANTKAFHEAKQAQDQLNFDRTHGQMQQKIDLMTEQLKQKGNTTTTTTVNPEGTQRTVNTRRGSSEDDDDPLGIRPGGGE